MKKALFLVLTLLCLSSAFSFDISIQPINNSVKPGGTISYEIKLENNDMYNRSVLIYMISNVLSASFSPSYSVEVPAGSNMTIILRARVDNSMSEGRYYDSVHFVIDKVIQTSQTISYTVEGPEKYFKFYSLDVPAVVDPRKEFNITLNFENGYGDRVSKVYAIVEIFKEDGESIFYSLKVIDTPVGNGSATIPINLNSSIGPTIANVRATIKWYSTSFGSKVAEFKIAGYTANSTSSISNATIVSSKNGLIVRNSGTLPISGFDYKMKIGKLDALFISGASVDYELEDGYIVFHVPDLEPGESVELYYETNYLVLYLLPILIFGMVYAVYYFKRKVVISREVLEFKSGRSHIGFKVVLKVKNVSKKTIPLLKIREPIPPIMSEVYDFGTLKGAVKRKGEKRYIVWEAKNLHKGESIVLSYRMRSRVGLIGELRLEGTEVELFDRLNRSRGVEKGTPIVIDIEPKGE